MKQERGLDSLEVNESHGLGASTEICNYNDRQLTKLGIEDHLVHLLRSRDMDQDVVQICEWRLNRDAARADVHLFGFIFASFNMLLHTFYYNEN